MAELEENKHGVFKQDLMRTFRQLKESRAESVSEDVEIIYKAVVPSDFDPAAFMRKDVEIGLNKRDVIIKLEIVIARYEYLFGAIADKSVILNVLPDWKSTIE